LTRQERKIFFFRSFQGTAALPSEKNSTTGIFPAALRVVSKERLRSKREKINREKERLNRKPKKNPKALPEPKVEK
jgi:hypothetical protein